MSHSLFLFIGEQDQNSYDINQLKKPVGEPHRNYPVGEKVVLPQATNKPKSRGKSTQTMWSVISKIVFGNLEI